MIKPFIITLIICFGYTYKIQAQEIYKYEASVENPYGLPNPNMPDQLLDFSLLIGECDCQSIRRIDQNTWGEVVSMIWKFKYIMNGMAIQDETFSEDGRYAGSIRQFVADSSRWYVHFYNSQLPTSVLSVWEGNKSKEGNIILYKDQISPNGMEGNYKITFSEISKKGFNWRGEWVTKDESIIYPTWKISCKKKILKQTNKN